MDIDDRLSRMESTLERFVADMGAEWTDLGGVLGDMHADLEEVIERCQQSSNAQHELTRLDILEAHDNLFLLLLFSTGLSLASLIGVLYLILR